MFKEYSFLFFSPLEQFEIFNLFYNFEYVHRKVFKVHWIIAIPMRLITSNGFLFIFFVLFFLTLSFSIIKFNNKLINNYNLYFFINFLFDFLKNLIQQNISTSYNDQKYNQYLLLIFFLILFSNLFGMVPYTFTITSHLLFTFSLSLSIFIGINIIGIRKLKLEFFQLFFPSGVPLIMGPFLIIIELISYLSRVFSLAIRLFANIMSGHTLLKILSSFVWIMMLKKTLWIFGSILPLIIIFIITGLEIFISVLQAYVFTVLVCIYINDVQHAH